MTSTHKQEQEAMAQSPSGEDGYHNRFDAIRTLLLVHQNKYLHSPLRDYPLSLDHYPSDWLDELQESDDETLWRYTMQDFETMEQKELKNYFVAATRLCQLERLPPPTATLLPGTYVNRIGPKKKHEILCLMGLFEQLGVQNGNFSHGVDIGGGMGHFSRVLTRFFKTPMCVVDSNSHLQSCGEKIALTAAREAHPAASLSFRELKLAPLPDPSTYKALRPVMDNQTLSLGLHTCGALALHQISWSGELGCKGLVNIGCCYTHLDPDQEVNLSLHARKHPVPINATSLLLATRAHHKSELDRFSFDLRVNSYRFGLDLLFRELLGQKPPQKAGYLKESDYRQNFCDYARARLLHLGITTPPADRLVQQFFDSPSTRRSLKRLFAASMLRWQLSRPLELYIILDRLLWLKERWFPSARLLELFDRQISPRNIAIIAQSEDLV